MRTHLMALTLGVSSMVPALASAHESGYGRGFGGHVESGRGHWGSGVREFAGHVPLFGRHHAWPVVAPAAWPVAWRVANVPAVPAGFERADLFASTLREQADRLAGTVQHEVAEGELRPEAITAADADRAELERDLQVASADGWISPDERHHLEAHLGELRAVCSEFRAPVYGNSGDAAPIAYDNNGYAPAAPVAYGQPGNGWAPNGR